MPEFSNLPPNAKYSNFPGFTTDKLFSQTNSAVEFQHVHQTHDTKVYHCIMVFAEQKIIIEIPMFRAY